MAKVFKGGRLDLEFYRGFKVVAHNFEILNDDCTAFDFTGIQDASFKIYAKSHGKLLFTYTILNGQITRTSNSLFLTISAADTATLVLSEYYCECLWRYSAIDELLFYGVGTMI